MRTVTYGAACSLDHYIAREDGSVDWLQWSDEVASISGELWKTLDTVIMGRKTYEAGLRMGTTSYPGMKNYVFSRTLEESPDENVQMIREDVAEFVARLKQESGKGICVMGGGELARSLFEADLIDEVGANIHPVLLGSGIPLFHPMSRQMDLELLENRTLKTGCVYLLYRVKRKV
ncbi:MAG TPA: dihydrofolate reductase family protein [Thermoanaerobaculia bacterium]|nr:dihydrofolate reductase family protein [Thermoanaerobaculia bacterium]